MSIFHQLERKWTYILTLKCNKILISFASTSDAIWHIQVFACLFTTVDVDLLPILLLTCLLQFWDNEMLSQKLLNGILMNIIHTNGYVMGPWQEVKLMKFTSNLPVHIIPLFKEANTTFQRSKITSKQVALY